MNEQRLQQLAEAKGCTLDDNADLGCYYLNAPDGYQFSDGSHYLVAWYVDAARCVWKGSKAAARRDLAERLRANELVKCPPGCDCGWDA